MSLFVSPMGVTPLVCTADSSLRNPSRPRFPVCPPGGLLNLRQLRSRPGSAPPGGWASGCGRGCSPLRMAREDTHPRAKFMSLPALRTPPVHGCHWWGRGWFWALRSVSRLPPVSSPSPGVTASPAYSRPVSHPPAMPCFGGHQWVLRRAGAGALPYCRVRCLQDFFLKGLER